MKYKKYTWGQTEAIFNMIGGEAAVDAVLAGKKKIVVEDVELATSPDQSKKFVALVVYSIPVMDELKRRFPAYIDPAFNDITFEPIKVCKKVSRETREVEFEYVHLNRNASNDEVLAEIDKRGLRPALPEELLAFDAKYPEEKTKFPIVALGSDTRHRSVAYLWSDDGGGRNLYLSDVGRGWDGDCRFLCVRKEEELAA